MNRIGTGDMAYASNKRPVMIISGIISLAVILICFILYVPLIKELKVRSRECKSIENQLSRARGIIGSTKLINEERASIAGQDVSGGMTELTARCNALGIEVIAIRPKETISERGGHFKILPIEMEIESSEQKFAAFAGSLAGLSKALIKIRSLDLSPNREDMGGIRANLVLDMYLTNIPGEITSLQDEETLLEEASVLPKRRAKKTGFSSWQRSSFMQKNIPSASSALTGILWDAKTPKAIISGYIVGRGDKVAGYTVIEIKQDMVILSDGSKNFEVRMGQ